MACGRERELTGSSFAAENKADLDICQFIVAGKAGASRVPLSST